MFNDAWRHGVDCQKVPHIGRGYLHMANDDAPYSVDGVWYCGRCHIFLSTMSHEIGARSVVSEPVVEDFSEVDERQFVFADDFDSIKADNEQLRKTLEDIASGELGINLCIRYAKKTLASSSNSGAEQ